MAKLATDARNDKAIQALRFTTRPCLIRSSALSQRPLILLFNLKLEVKMKIQDYKERLNGPFMWINEALEDAKRFYVEDNPEWVRRMATSVAEYAITLAQYAEDWHFKREMNKKFGEL